MLGGMWICGSFLFQCLGTDLILVLIVLLDPIYLLGHLFRAFIFLTFVPLTLDMYLHISGNFLLVRFLVVCLKTFGPLHINKESSGPGLFWLLSLCYVTVITSQDQDTNLLQDSQSITQQQKQHQQTPNNRWKPMPLARSIN